MKLETFRDKDGKTRVRLRWANGRIFMSSEAYERRSTVRRLAEKAMAEGIDNVEYLDGLSPERR